MPPEGESCSDEMIEFLKGSDREIESQWNGSILIHTLEGSMEASPGDWIIKGTAGEYYPCKPDVFKDVYEPA